MSNIRCCRSAVLRATRRHLVDVRECTSWRIVKPKLETLEIRFQKVEKKTKTEDFLYLLSKG